VNPEIYAAEWGFFMKTRLIYAILIVSLFAVLLLAAHGCPGYFLDDGTAAAQSPAVVFL